MEDAMAAAAEREGIGAPEPRPVVWFEISVQRQPSFYLKTVMYPTCLIVTVTIFGLFSPSDDARNRQEKVKLKAFLHETSPVTFSGEPRPDLHAVNFGCSHGRRRSNAQE